MICGRLRGDMANTALPKDLVGHAIALAGALAKSQKVVSARARIGLFYQDGAATELFRKVSEYGQKLHEKRDAGMQLSEGEINEFDELRKAVVDNPLCKGFLEAREQLDAIVATINQYLYMAIEKGTAPTDEEVAAAMQTQYSACGCGGSCHGECSGECTGECHGECHQDGHECSCGKHA